MKITITEEDLDKAIEIYTKTRCTTDDCLIAQVGKRLFGDMFRTVGYSIITKDGRYYRPAFNSEDKLIWNKLINLFDHEHYEEVRLLLPVTVEINS